VIWPIKSLKAEDPVKMRRYFVISVLAGMFYIAGLIPVSAQEEDLGPLLGKISKRMNSYPENDNWKARIVTKNAEMDEEWQPKKTIITTVIIKSVDNMLSSEVLEAMETEDGAINDITEKIAKQTEEQIERTNKQTSEQMEQKGTENSPDPRIPFDEGKRPKYTYHRLDDAVINERPVFLIEAVAKEKDQGLFEGKYYIDQETYDVLKAQVKPSKNPKFVKELDMDIDFEVLPEGNYIEKKSKTRVNGGPFFKRVRMIFEVEYFDIEILDSKAM
jgi:hypothetical protein